MPSSAAPPLVALDTPAVVVDLPAVERNVTRMQSYCDGHGLGLWPHVKSHKMVDVAALQIAAGAEGLTCQTLGEAEVMADAGFDRLLVPTPVVGARKVVRLAGLARRASLTVACDSGVGARAMSEALAHAGVRVEVLVELDVGLGRTGVRGPAQAAALAGEIESLDSLDHAGLLAHPTSPATASSIEAACAAIEGSGLPVARVSGGGTLHAELSHLCPPLTELRAGVYALGDRSTVAAGNTSPADAALTVRATVVSRPTPTTVIIDAGSKTLTNDAATVTALPGYGSVIEYPEAVIERLSEEHGHIELRDGGPRPAVGDVLTVLPNHACGVMNLHDEVLVRDGAGAIEQRAVQARGRTR